FEAPEAKNAATTMVVMGVMAMSLFLGISFLATHMNLVPTEESESILSQMTRFVTAGVPAGGLIYYWVQLFTMLILVLAANTGYQDFPRLSYFLARDGFLPRWMQNLGDRLVFSSGIVVLAILSLIIVIVFRANEIAMLPLYALGVMISFTISQSGMVRLWDKISKIPPGEELVTGSTTLRHESGIWWKKVLNGTGAIVTFIVLLVLVATKFIEGAWVVVVAIPLLILLFRAIKNHYREVAQRLRTRDLTSADVAEVADIVLVPIADIHRGTLRALKYAKRLSNNVRAVTVITHPDQKERIVRRWNRFPELTKDEQLLFIEYEYRDVLDPLVEYITRVNNVEFPNQLVTVVIPEFVPGSITEHLLHNQTANFLRIRLRSQPDVVVIDVPYHI
ncbi:MAG: APC family permease, partial [Ardenticatenaceae bacterium]